MYLGVNDEINIRLHDHPGAKSRNLFAFVQKHKLAQSELTQTLML